MNSVAKQKGMEPLAEAPVQAECSQQRGNRANYYSEILILWHQQPLIDILKPQVQALALRAASKQKCIVSALHCTQMRMTQFYSHISEISAKYCVQKIHLYTVNSVKMYETPLTQVIFRPHGI